MSDSDTTKKRILTVSGPSGAGKTYLVDTLLTKHSSGFVRIPTVVTREPRSQEEIDRGEYVFVTGQEFEGLKRRDEFLWSLEFGGAWYGTCKSDVVRTLEGGPYGIMTLAPDVIRTLRWFVNERNGNDNAILSVSIHATPPVRMERLQNRGMNAKDISKRMIAEASWDEKITHAGYYRIINNTRQGIEYALCELAHLCQENGFDF